MTTDASKTDQEAAAGADTGAEDQKQDQHQEHDPNEGVQFDDGIELGQTDDSDEGQDVDDSGKEKAAEGAETETADKKEADEDDDPDAFIKKLDPKIQEKINKRIGKSVSERKAAENQLAQKEKELAEREAEIAELRGAEEDVVIPPMPDPLDDDYDEQVKARDEALQKAGAIRAKREEAEREQEKAAEKQRVEIANAIEERIQKMYSDAKTDLGMEQSDFEKIDKVVVESLPKDAAFLTKLLGRDDTAVLVKYLHDAPLVREKFDGMDSFEAWDMLNTIAPEAAKLKGGATKAPEPHEIPEGKRTGEHQDPALDGVTFE